MRKVQFAFEVCDLLLERYQVGLHVVHALARRYLGRFGGHQVLEFLNAVETALEDLVCVSRTLVAVGRYLIEHGGH